MSKGYEFLKSCIIFIIFYIFVVFYSNGNQVLKEIIMILPFYILICFGCYGLYRIGIGLINFNDQSNEDIQLIKRIDVIKSIYINKYKIKI